MRVLRNFVYILLLIPTTYIFAKVWNSTINKIKSPRNIFWVFLIFPLSQFILTTVIFVEMQYPTFKILNYSDVLQLLAFGLTEIADVIFLYFISSVERKHELETELIELKNIYSLEAEHYENIEARRDEIAKIRHDFNSQLGTAYALFSNMLDNAINENLNIEDVNLRYINIKAVQKNEFLYVKVINPLANNKADNTAKKIISKNGNHGYGQKILSDIAKNYDGSFEINKHDDLYEAVIIVKVN